MALTDFTLFIYRCKVLFYLLLNWFSFLLHQIYFSCYYTEYIIKKGCCNDILPMSVSLCNWKQDKYLPIFEVNLQILYKEAIFMYADYLELKLLCNKIQREHCAPSFISRNGKSHLKATLCFKHIHSRGLGQYPVMCFASCGVAGHLKMQNRNVKSWKSITHLFCCFWRSNFSSLKTDRYRCRDRQGM